MPHTVILGGGIIGLSAAYYLAKLSKEAESQGGTAARTIHIVEPCPELFASASGKAGGFIARDWFNPAVAPLGALSFDLHRTLAEAHAGSARWGWSESVSYSLDRNSSLASGSVTPSNELEPEQTESEVDLDAEQARLELPYWLQTPPHAAQAISDRKTTGQLNPHQLCEFLLEECIDMGVRLHHPARASRLSRADANDPNSQTMIALNLLATTSTGREIRTGTLDIPCDSLIIAAGCWTPEVFRTLFPNAARTPAIQNLAGYSVTLRSKHWAPRPPAHTQAPRPCHAIFTSDPSGYSPELYSRAGGDLWLGGVNSAALPLPARAMDARADPAAVARMLAVGRELCGDDVEVLESGLCFRPVAPSGKPTVARVEPRELGAGIAPPAVAGGGVYLAVGHGPWGISLCLGTGLVVSEMILQRPTSTDVSGLAKW
ncbi:FAD dependent oxidoreductase [Wolfiporia cocos MD-104 SS10]|uniref:FAD dependent oxidoreductase n=1 Tax=Wolfiporia cocos (strain MD-104) TaxID=742152 RepID=A0A2H3JPX4_WOLCO|nr:FAD dependent oxidoreductase [Wolfiporia cocos MD-104 SS10]